MNFCSFIEFCGKNSGFFFDIFFRTIYYFQFNFFFVNNWLNNRLLINGTSRNLNWFFNYFSFFLNTSENRFEFFFLNISFIDINFLIDCVFFWLDVSIILDFVSRNLNRFLNLLIRKLGWKHNRFSFNYFIFSVNEFRFGSNEFVQNGWLFNNLLSNREFNLF